MRAWVQAGVLCKPLLTSLCALSERIAQASVCVEADGSMRVSIEAPRRARLPIARFPLESPDEARAACAAIKAPESDAQALILACQTLRELFEPLAPAFALLLSQMKTDLLSLAASLPTDPNLPGGLERDDQEIQDALSDAIENPSTRQAALAIARLLIHPEHPLSALAGALISEADSEDIEQALNDEPSAPSLADGSQQIRSFSRARSL